MFIGKKIAAFCFCIGLTVSVFAETVVLSVIQNENAPGRALEYTRGIESAVMDALFLDGHIVSNDTIKSSDKFFADRRFGIETARNGMADYYVCIFVEYKKGEDNESMNETPELKQVSYRFVTIYPEEIQKDVVITDLKVKEQNVEKFSAVIAKEIESNIVRRINENKGR